MAEVAAAAVADERVAGVRDDPRGRLALLRMLYELPPDVDRGYLPYRRAASAFIGWQLRRGLLNPPSGPTPGSPWWRTLHETLIRDTTEARDLYDWSAAALELPTLGGLLARPRSTPAYAWDPRDSEVWHPEPSRLARAARAAVPVFRPR